jgi:hypothetical protein
MEPPIFKTTPEISLTPLKPSMGALNTGSTNTQIPSFLCRYVRNFVDQRILLLNIDRLHQETDGESEPEDQWMLPDISPTAEESFSAVVMVDISGYSKISSILVDRGTEGTELLAKTMKGYLDKVNFLIRVKWLKHDRSSTLLSRITETLSNLPEMQ